MNILTPTEISGCLTGGPTAVARAIEAAVIKRLAAGVSVEPSFFNVMDGKTAYIPYYTPKQFTTAIAAARVQENERCAKVCESTSWSEDIDVWREMTKRDVSVKSMLACAEAIRASIGETK